MRDKAEKRTKLQKNGEMIKMENLTTDTRHTEQEIERREKEEQIMVVRHRL